MQEILHVYHTVSHYDLKKEKVLRDINWLL